MKIRKVTLKEVAIREENGEFEKVFVNEKTYPLFLTNYALKKGKDMGFINSSLFGELLRMKGLERLIEASSDDEFEFDEKTIESLDETKMVQVIYLAFIGANRSTDVAFDDFLERYHNSFMDTVYLYIDLIGDLIDSDPNAFKNGLNKSTSTGNKNKKKSNRRR